MNFNKLYNQVVNYFWLGDESKQKNQTNETEEMSHIARINRLNNLLKDTNYSQIQKQQISMFYSALIKQYTTANSTLNFPIFLYQPPFYTPKISFMIPINIKNQKIYCVLQLVVIFSEGLEKQMPNFYIRNPDYRKYKPNKKYVKFGKYDQEGKYYESILGGLKLYLPQISKQRWSWTKGNYFREQNILNIVKWIHKQLFLDYFPFSSRKAEQFDTVQAQAQALFKFLTQNVSFTAETQQSRLLKSLQQLETIQKIIEFETNVINIENNKLKQIKQPKCQFEQINLYFSHSSNQHSESILDTLSSLQALKDTTHFIQFKFYHKQITLSEFLTFAQLNFQKQFDQRMKIARLTSG